MPASVTGNYGVLALGGTAEPHRVALTGLGSARIADGIPVPDAAITIGNCNRRPSGLPYCGDVLMSSLTGAEMSVLSGYFRSPFPSTKGFSAYRMPGVAVHGPLIFAFSLVGFFLCWPHPMLRPLLIVWVLAGLYLGRDIAIICHYAPLLIIICWAVAGFVLFRPALILRFGSHVLISAMLSVGLGAVLFLVAFKMTREEHFERSKG